MTLTEHLEINLPGIKAVFYGVCLMRHREPVAEWILAVTKEAPWNPRKR